MKNRLNCVLLVDDDEPTNFLNEMVINSTNATDYVHTTQTAMEALDFLTQNGKYERSKFQYATPDLIFLDINMPGLNGWDFLEEFQKMEVKDKDKIVIVLLTNSYNPDDERKAREIKEVYAYKHKPLTIAAVNDIIANYFTQT